MFKLGDLVTHGVWWSKTKRVQAIVRKVHRDKTVTVEDRFWLDDTGERTGTYLNGTQRLPAGICEACQ
jgi:hypothetical protein